MATTRRLLLLVTCGAAATVATMVRTASRSRPVPAQRQPPDPPPDLPPGRVVAVPGHGELFVRQASGPSASPTVLLLHGWMFPADLNWFPVYRPLAEIASVVAVDHRGHGRGPRPSEPFRLVDAADDAAALVRHLDLGQVIVVGYSMGGAIAQLLWRRHPDVVRGLVLCATAASFRARFRDRALWRAMGVLQMGLRLVPRSTWERLAEAQTRGHVRVKVSRMLNADTPPEVLERLSWVIGELDRGSAEDLAEAGRELGRFDVRTELAGVDVATAVIVTTRDELVPVSAQEELAERIPHAQRYAVDGDHDAVIAQAQEFVSALLKAVQHVVDATAPDAV